ncbi:capsid [uncultured virus]|uniref:Capsid n=1 Tax=uncultured virus TaxID=340016 RepID=A0A2K9LS16_9VIRU|nr:capsid [uncultured virus]
MPKRTSTVASSSSSKPWKSSARKHWRFPAGHPMARSGFGSVARARGAAVTGEMKYFDCDRSLLSITAVTTTWPAGTIVDPGTTINLGSGPVATPLCLFAPTVGAGLNQRIGRKVKVMKVKLHYELNVSQQAAQAAGDAGSYIRLLLVLDKQTNAAQMTSAALLNDGTAADTTICAFQNPNNFGRFKVLKEKHHTFQSPSTFNDAATTGATYGLVQKGKMSYRFKVPLHVNFNATNGGTVADIIDNSFHIIIGGNTTAGLNPQIAYYSRVCFKE